MIQYYITAITTTVTIVALALVLKRRIIRAALYNRPAMCVWLMVVFAPFVIVPVVSYGLL